MKEGLTVLECTIIQWRCYEMHMWKLMKYCCIYLKDN